MPKKLFITNERMLQLVQWAIQNSIAANEREYFEMIGFIQNNISSVRTGSLSFTKEQILAACRITGASADWIYGFSSVMLRRKPARPIDALKDAVRAIEQELSNGIKRR